MKKPIRTNRYKFEKELSLRTKINFKKEKFK